MILIDLLTQGVKKKKQAGWMRVEMKLHDFYADDTIDSSNKMKQQKTNVRTVSKTAYKPQLCAAEKTQLLHHYNLLETFLFATHCIKKGNKCTIKKRNGSASVNPKTLSYLLFSWNVSKGGLFYIKTSALTAAVLRGVRTEDMALCTSMVPDHSESSTKNLSVIEDQDFVQRL